MASTPLDCSSVNTAGGMKPRTGTALQPSRPRQAFISAMVGMRSVPMPAAASPDR